MSENEIAAVIVDAAFRIHKKLGPGLFKSVYEAVLAYELGTRGLAFIRQQEVPVIYENVRMEIGFRADLVVENKVIVEIKSVDVIAPIHKTQLLTYLRLTDKRLGLLINFNVVTDQNRNHPNREQTMKNVSRQGRKGAKTQRYRIRVLLGVFAPLRPWRETETNRSRLS